MVSSRSPYCKGQMTSPTLRQRIFGIMNHLVILPCRWLSLGPRMYWMSAIVLIRSCLELWTQTFVFLSHLVVILRQCCQLLTMVTGSCLVTATRRTSHYESTTDTSGGWGRHGRRKILLRSLVKSGAASVPIACGSFLVHGRQSMELARIIRKSGGGGRVHEMVER